MFALAFRCSNHLARSYPRWKKTYFAQFFEWKQDDAGQLLANRYVSFTGQRFLFLGQSIQPLILKEISRNKNKSAVSPAYAPIAGTLRCWCPILITFYITTFQYRSSINKKLCAQQFKSRLLLCTGIMCKKDHDFLKKCVHKDAAYLSTGGVLRRNSVGCAAAHWLVRRLLYGSPGFDSSPAPHPRPSRIIYRDAGVHTQLRMIHSNPRMNIVWINNKKERQQERHQTLNIQRIAPFPRNPTWQQRGPQHPSSSTPRGHRISKEGHVNIVAVVGIGSKPHPPPPPSYHS
jgi:hypothetical protein